MTAFNIIVTLILITMPSRSIKSYNDETIYFTSLNYAVHQGQFDGVSTVGSLRSTGDFGLGSEAKLKGELVVLDGKFYSINAEGTARLLEDSDSISYAAIKSFRSDVTIDIGSVPSMDELEDVLAERVNQNAFAAIKIRGTFNTIQLRSFEEQEKPYPKVEDVPEIKFERKDMKGTMVGYYTPKSAEVLNSPIFHFHFIDDAKTTGGHVLDVDLSNATVEIDYAEEVHVQLPDKKATDHVDLNTSIDSKG